jgi:hypothetical protein
MCLCVTNVSAFQASLETIKQNKEKNNNRTFNNNKTSLFRPRWESKEEMNE